MKRREFITLLGGAAAWPIAARAQQATKSARVSYVRSGSAQDDPYRQSFLRGMRDNGYVEGRGITFEFHYWGDDVAATRPLIDSLVRSKVDVIVVGGTPTARAAQAATQSIPIVLVANDPVGSGLAASLARPGGNITGLAAVAPDVQVKRLEVLKEILPRVARIAVLQHPDNPSHAAILKETEVGARTLGLAMRTFAVRKSDEFELVFNIMSEWPADAAFVFDDSAFIANRVSIAMQAARQRLPLVCGFRSMTEAGCLFSYAEDLGEMWYHLARYVAKILKGTKPADLPIEQPVKFQLIINLKTAKSLGLEVPPTLLARADEVIE
jgi:ABC-type uncharacterized transport system substrate-binding protein